MARKPGFTFEKKHTGLVGGIDEAGRGPLAGPVVAAAVVFKTYSKPRGLNDSKQLTREEREMLHGVIVTRAAYGIGIASREEIDEFNILGATKLAMLRAYEALPIRADVMLIDGNQLPKLTCHMEAIVDGDCLSASIAAASIIAKVTRDRIMCELAKTHPHYGWETNVGYGTAEHYRGLESHGACEHHRRSFAPVQRVLQKAVA